MNSAFGVVVKDLEAGIIVGVVTFEGPTQRHHGVTEADPAVITDQHREYLDQIVGELWDCLPGDVLYEPIAWAAHVAGKLNVQEVDIRYQEDR